MKCPFCDELEDKVVDSRMAKEGEVIRRRRECLRCKRRYTTYERVEEILPVVVKKDGRRESFDRTKILLGMKKACEKRPISTGTLEAVTDRI
ncbi:MAG: ATP cone domain-containing protein, partial [Nitrospiraceae bacterium]